MSAQPRTPRTDWKRAPYRAAAGPLDPITADAVWDRFLGFMATMSAAAAARQPGMPSRVAFVMKRRRDPDYARRADAVMASRRLQTSGRKRITADQWSSFLARVGSACIRPLCREPGMPSEAAVYKRRGKDPAFAAELATTLRARLALRLAAAMATRRRNRPPKATPPRERPPGEVFREALLSDALYRSVLAALPRALDPITRDDVAADMVLAVLSGELAETAIAAAAPTFLKQHRKLFGNAGAVSLDAAIPDTDGLTLLDTLSGEAADYWSAFEERASVRAHG